MLVDTHVLIWLLEGIQGRLGEKTHHLLQEEGEDLVTSTASLYEMRLKERKGGLAVGATSRISETLESHQIPMLDITPAHILNIPDSKLTTLSDPFDLLLIAQAKTDRLTFLTVDTAILKANLPGLRLLDGRM